MKQLDELLVKCIRCGFCLEACPTFQLSGSEVESPRGRIYLVRSALEGKLSQDDIQPHMDRCLGCLACETACPSGVEYGAILELAREQQNKYKTPQLMAKKALIDSTTNKLALRTNLNAGKFLPGTRIPSFISKLVSGDSEAEVDRPSPQKQTLSELGDENYPPIVGEVYFLQGCAMDVLYQNVHAAAKRLLRRVGYQVREVKQGCCGSMHVHAGFLDDAKSRAENLMKAMSDDIPIVVDSAGCGSTMKRYRELCGNKADQFSDRVFDVSEFLLSHGLKEPLADANYLIGTSLTYHDACHLAHGQQIKSAPRELLQSIPGVELVELEEADMCCGSAGVYNTLQPKIARALLERKMDRVSETKVQIVALGNPGCHAWMAQGARERWGADVKIMHTVEVLEAAFTGF